MKLVMRVFACLFLFQALSAKADSQELYRAITSIKTQYAVSGILRLDSDGVIIKLVQGTKLATSSDEAIGVFTREVLSQYPGYSIIDTLSAPIKPVKMPCGQSI